MPIPHLDDLHAFGLAVRSLRHRAQLSQEQLADLVGVHRTYVGSVERGERNVSLRNIAAFAAALDCTASELLRIAERMKADADPEQRREKR